MRCQLQEFANHTEKGKEQSPAPLQMSEMPEHEWHTAGIEFKESLP